MPLIFQHSTIQINFMMYQIQEYLKQNNISDFSKFSLRDDGEGIFFDKWGYNIAKPNIEELNLKEKLIRKITDIKVEASDRINKLYPQYKQNNISIAVSAIQNKELQALRSKQVYQLMPEDIITLKKSKQCMDYINLMRSCSNSLEALVMETDINEVENIDATDDMYWSADFWA